MLACLAFFRRRQLYAIARFPCYRYRFVGGEDRGCGECWINNFAAVFCLVWCTTSTLFCSCRPPVDGNTWRLPPSTLTYLLFRFVLAFVAALADVDAVTAVVSKSDYLEKESVWVVVDADDTAATTLSDAGARVRVENYRRRVVVVVVAAADVVVVVVVVVVAPPFEQVWSISILRCPPPARHLSSAKADYFERKMTRETSKGRRLRHKACIPSNNEVLSVPLPPSPTRWLRASSCRV